MQRIENATAPDQRLSSVAGYILCSGDELILPTRWNLRLPLTHPVCRKTSLTERKSSIDWETTRDASGPMCGDIKNVTRVPGSPGGDFVNITHDCQAL